MTRYTDSLGFEGQGSVTLNEDDEGQIKIVGHVPRVVLVSDDLFRQMVEQINELRRLKREDVKS